jgi:Tfp pilus assembly protein PilZ
MWMRPMTNFPISEGCLGKIIFFGTESAYSIGEAIRLFLNLEHETLQCEARVVRVEPRNGQFGVAVEMKSYVFC